MGSGLSVGTRGFVYILYKMNHMAYRHVLERVTSLLTYPVQDRWSITQVLIGGFVMGGGIASAVLLPVWSRLSGNISLGPLSLITAALLFFVPHTIVQGYVLRTVRSVQHGNPRIPPFTGIVSLFQEGLAAFAVIIGYGILPATVYGTTLIAPEPVVSVLSGTAAMLAVIAVFFLPAGLTRFAVTRDVMAAFDLAMLHRVASSRTYATACLTALALRLLLLIPQTIVTTVLALTVIGLLFAPAVILYQFLVYAQLFGTLDIWDEQR